MSPLRRALFPFPFLGIVVSASFAQPPAKVTTVAVTTRLFQPTTQVLGEAESVRQVKVSAEVEGLVEAMSVDEGARVAVGAPLLQLETKTREILARGAAAQLRVAEEQLKEYRAGSRPEEIRAAEQAAVEARALLDEAEDELERQKGLLDSELGSTKELMAARARAHSRRAILQRLEAQLELVRQGPRAEVIARAEAQVLLQKAQLDTIEDELAKARVLAPFDGVIAEKLVDKGTYVRRGDPVFSLVQLNPIRVALTVPEWLVGKVVKDATLEVTFDAFPEQTFTGRVESIIPTADRASRTFPVKLLLPNDEHRLLPGMVARAAIPTAKGSEALAVPRDALVRSPAGTIVYKVVEDAVQPVPVQLGATAGAFVAVTGPLAAEDRVVVRGNEALRPGQKVIVVDGGPAQPRGGR